MLPTGALTVLRRRARRGISNTCAVLGSADSKVFWCQAGLLGDSAEHSRAYFVTIVKGENKVGPTRS